MRSPARAPISVAGALDFVRNDALASTCPSCGAAPSGQIACPRCGRRLVTPAVQPVVPTPRLFHMETTSRGLRFVGRPALLIVILLLILLPPLGLVLAFAKTEVRIEGDVVEIRSFAMPTTRTGRFPIHTVADVAWTSEPAKNGGFNYRAELVLTDATTVGLGFYGGQPQVLHIVDALRNAIAAQKKAIGLSAG